jgi:DNA-directed RNA polymerase beta' subunit
MAAEERITEVKEQYNMGLLTNEERRNRTIEIWNETKNKITDAVRRSPRQRRVQSIRWCTPRLVVLNQSWYR